MWNDRKYLLFHCITNLFYCDQEFGIRTLPKLTMDNIVLMSYSKMKVKLATPVLRKSVAISRQESGKDDVLGTGTFFTNMNHIFD